MTSLYWCKFQNSLLLISLLTGCTYMSQGVIPVKNRGAIPASNDSFGDTATEIIYPNQNWSWDESLWFYNTSQGSDLMSYDIFLNIEQSNKEELFRNDENMQRYRFLSQSVSMDNPDHLPIGFVKDRYQGNEYIGFTCAACHTTQINYKGKGIRIDGGPAMADMQSMLEDLADALDSTLHHTENSERLVKRIYGEKFTSSEKQDISDRLQRDWKIMQEYVTNNASHKDDDKNVKINYGYARMDAFGRIYNRVMSHIAPASYTANSPNAPVSYPFLWDTPQHDFVQWNGVGDNKNLGDLGPLGRNTGEVIGVFATFEIIKNNPKWYEFLTPEFSYPSSVKARNQMRLEKQLKTLWSPAWSELANLGILKPYAYPLDV